MSPSEALQRRDPGDICLYIYTSAPPGAQGLPAHTTTTGRSPTPWWPRACSRKATSSYLFLPLAHAFAILIQFASFELGVTLAYWSWD